MWSRSAHYDVKDTALRTSETYVHEVDLLDLFVHYLAISPSGRAVGLPRLNIPNLEGIVH
jgi:hypothetical protein